MSFSLSPRVEEGNNILHSIRIACCIILSLYIHVYEICYIVEDMLSYMIFNFYAYTNIFIYIYSANKTYLYQQTKALLNPKSLMKFLEDNIKTM